MIKLAGEDLLGQKNIQNKVKMSHCHIATLLKINLQ